MSEKAEQSLKGGLKNLIENIPGARNLKQKIEEKQRQQWQETMKIVREVIKTELTGADATKIQFSPQDLTDLAGYLQIPSDNKLYFAIIKGAPVISAIDPRNINPNFIYEYGSGNEYLGYNDIFLKQKKQNYIELSKVNKNGDLARIINKVVDRTKSLIKSSEVKEKMIEGENPEKSSSELPKLSEFDNFHTMLQELGTGEKKFLRLKEILQKSDWQEVWKALDNMVLQNKQMSFVKNPSAEIKKDSPLARAINLFIERLEEGDTFLIRQQLEAVRRKII